MPSLPPPRHISTIAYLLFVYTKDAVAFILVAAGRDGLAHHYRRPRLTRAGLQQRADKAHLSCSDVAGALDPRWHGGYGFVSNINRSLPVTVGGSAGQRDHTATNERCFVAGPGQSIARYLWALDPGRGGAAEVKSIQLKEKTAGPPADADLEGSRCRP